MPRGIIYKIFLLLIIPVFCSGLDVSDIVVVPKVILDHSGYSGDLAVSPSDGSLNVIWASSDGLLKYIRQSVAGTLGTPEIIPTPGQFVYGDEQSGDGRWARKCCGITVDETGQIHIVYTIRSGDIFYINGYPGNWSLPYKAASSENVSCHPEIEVIHDDLFIIWEDPDLPTKKNINEIHRINGQWSTPRVIMAADNPDLIRGGNGMLYICGRLFNVGEPDYDWDHNILFGSFIPGYQDWNVRQLTHSTYRIGKAPRLFVYNEKIFMTWSTSVGIEASSEWDTKGRLYCAGAPEPGNRWNLYYSPNTDPIYTVATGDPYGVVAVYSDGTMFYANGKCGVLGTNSDQSYKIWLGNRWSGLRPAEWENGLTQLASDGKTVWAVSSSTATSDQEVVLSGYTLPQAPLLDFANHPPVLMMTPDTFALRNMVWQGQCQAQDPDGDTLIYALTTAPEGCEIDPETGLLTFQAGAPDTHIIGIKVKDGRGKADTRYMRLHVVEKIVTAGFHAEPVNGMAPLAVQFSNTSSGPITQTLWDFGDGTTSLLNSPNHTYQTPGLYTVQLIAAGNIYSDTLRQEQLITVNTPPTIANFAAAPLTGTAPLTVQFTDSSTGVITSCLWDFGDGETSQEQHPVHHYGGPGVYTVRLTVTGPGGTAMLEMPDYIHIEPVVPPEAAFSADPLSGPAPLTVQFTNQTSGSVLEYEWYFGDTYTADGGKSNILNPMYTYTHPGIYSVMLTAVGPDSADVALVHNLIEVLDPTSVETAALPSRFFMYSNMPNPFNMNTMIQYELPCVSEVKLAVYDARGEKIRDLVESYLQPGRHMAIWNGTNKQGQMMSSGIYIVRMQAGNFHHEVKVMLLK